MAAHRAPPPPTYVDVVWSQGLSKEQMKERFPSDAIHSIARQMTRWRSIDLGLPKNVVSEIDEANEGEQEKKIKFLQRWSEAFGFKATYEQLAVSFCASNRLDLAEAVCKERKLALSTPTDNTHIPLSPNRLSVDVKAFPATHEDSLTSTSRDVFPESDQILGSVETLPTPTLSRRKGSNILPASTQEENLSIESSHPVFTNPSPATSQHQSLSFLASALDRISLLLKSQHDSNMIEKRELKDQIDGYIKEKKELLEELEGRRTEIKKLEKKVEETGSQLDESRKKYHEAKDNLKELCSSHEEKEAITEKVKNVKNEKDEALKALGDHQQEVSRVKYDLDQTKKNKNRLLKQLQWTETDLSHYATIFDKLYALQEQHEKARERQQNAIIHVIVFFLFVTFLLGGLLIKCYQN